MAWMKFGETCRARLNSQRPSRLFCRVRAVADALARNFDPRRLTSAIDGRTPGGAPTGVGLRVAAGRNQTGGLKSAQARSLRRSQSPEGAASRSAGLWTGPPCPGGTAMTRKQVSDPALGQLLRFANLETRRVVGDPAVVAGQPELRFGMNAGAASAPTVRPEGACRSRHMCRASKRHGAAAVPTERPPRR